MAKHGPSAYGPIQRNLSRARRRRAGLSAARTVVAVGLGVLVCELLVFAGLRWLWPEALPRFWSGLGWTTVLLVGVGIAAWTAGWWHRRGLQLAAEAERHVPEFGRALTTSVELSGERGDRCPPALREALWRETSGRLETESWRRFTAGRAVGAWSLIAGLVLVFQGLLWWSVERGTLPSWADPEAVSVSPAVHEPPSAEELLEDAAAAEQDRLRTESRLDILEPGEDQWATKIEAISLRFESKTPYGVEDVRVSLRVNGGDPVYVPALTGELEAGTAEGDAEFYLDELELRDYDLVAYHLEAKAKGREASSPGRKITSGVFFVQVRPFDNPAFVVINPTGPKSPAEGVLNWMIEEQRRLIRGNWLLQDGTGLEPDQELYTQVAERVGNDQRELAEVGDEVYELFEENPKTTPIMLVLLTEGRDAIDAAIEDLDAAAYDQALSHQQEALSKLVAILSEFVKILGKTADLPETGQAPKPPPSSEKKRDLPQGLSLKDRQLYRDDVILELEEIEHQQAQLNWEEEEQAAAEPGKRWHQPEPRQNPEASGDPAVPSTEGAQASAEEDPADSSSEDQVTPVTGPTDPPADSSSAEASAEPPSNPEPGQQRLARRSENSPNPGSPPPSGSKSPPGPGTTGQGTSGTSGSGGRGQRQGQTAQPQAESASTPAKQMARAQRQQALADRMQQLADEAVTTESVRRAMEQAQRSMQDRADALRESAEGGSANPDAETAAASSAAVGEQAEQYVRIARQRRDDELQAQRVQRISEMMARLAESSQADRGTSSGQAGQAGSDELAAMAEELGRMAQQARARAEAAGQSSGQDQGDGGADTSQNAQAAQAAEVLGVARDQLRRAADQARERPGDQSADHAESMRALAAAQRSLAGDRAQLEALSRQLEDFNQQLRAQELREERARKGGAGLTPEAEAQWEAWLESRTPVWEAQLEDAVGPSEALSRFKEVFGGNGDGGEPGGAESPSLPAAGSAREPGRGGGRGPAGDSDRVDELMPRRLAVVGVLREVQARLERLIARDALVRQRSHQTPPTYRELVDLYFETLSRQSAAADSRDTRPPADASDRPDASTAP
ncbi:MAG: hypothetical protein AAGG38_02375 [Planctomycetota bacterium]